MYVHITIVYKIILKGEIIIIVVMIHTQSMLQIFIKYKLCSPT